MLVFGTTFASFSEVLFFLPHSEIDTLISKDSVPFIIFRARVLVFSCDQAALQMVQSGNAQSGSNSTIFRAV